MLPPLRRDATIGIIATSAPTAARCPRRLARAVSELERLGYRVKFAAGVLRRAEHAWAAGTARERARDIHDLVADDEVTALMSTVGGLVSNGVLEHLNWELLACHPKLMIGYSDLTVLHAGIWTRTGIGGIYGPALLPQFGEPGGADPFTIAALESLVGGAGPVGLLAHPSTWIVGRRSWDEEDDEPRARSPAPALRVIREGYAEGPMIPVNLDALLRLAGTHWFPSLEGAVLALEVSDDSSPGRLHSSLEHLRQLGGFQHAAGVAFGRFAPRCGIDDSTLDAIVDACVDPRLPLAAGFSFGHTDPMISLPWGARCALDAGTPVPTLAVLEPVVTAV